MRLSTATRRLLPVVATAAVFSGGAAAQAASSVSLCVPSKSNAAVTSASSSGTCALGSTAVALPATRAAQQTLLSILPDIKFVSAGIDGKPTIQFNGVNVQLINGSGSETTVNGEGNLVIGYDPKPGTQTGSHNLVLGTSGQGYSSYGGIDAGVQSDISAPQASVLGGLNNTASGTNATITGGEANQAAGQDGSVVGGIGNQAGGVDSTVSGGGSNRATGASASILGGFANVASGNGGTVGGGTNNTASGGNSSANSVSGGTDNTATGQNSWVGGGEVNTASGTVGEASGTTRTAISVNTSNWNGSAGFGSSGPNSYVDGSGIVHLEGAVTQTSNSGSAANLIGFLPAGEAPSRNVFTIVHTFAGTYSDLVINTNGAINLLPSSTTNPQFVSLEGITFRP
jgi:hypothetical protein